MCRVKYAPGFRCYLTPHVQSEDTPRYRSVLSASLVPKNSIRLLVFVFGSARYRECSHHRLREMMGTQAE